MVDKVVIAAAGQGTRMKQLTNNKCKHLIKVNGRPFLAYLLDNLFEAGYRDLVLVVGYKEEMMKCFVDDYKPKVKDKYKITLVSQYDILGPKEKEYGTACPVKCVKDIVKKDDFIYLNGDNLYSVDDLKSMNISDGFNYVAGLNLKNPEKYGVLVSDDGFLNKIVEKPKEFVSNLINTGLYKFTSDIFEAVLKIKKSPRGEYEITDAVSLLAKEKKVKIIRIKDHWLDFGNPADIIRLSRFLKSQGIKPSNKKSKCGL